MFQFDRVLLQGLHETTFTDLHSTWRDIEDILTSDFFGVLDYLPRKPFLASFIDYVVFLNPDVQTPIVDGVDWDHSDLQFWPRISVQEEKAEPDVVIVTDKWVLVIEVKLDSDLGHDQPWREFTVGRALAEERGLLADRVYYLLVARRRLDIAGTFASTEVERRNELVARTSYVRWHEIVALVESWLRAGCDEQALMPEQGRMLADLLAALRKRRSIAFSGYAFSNAATVEVVVSPLFCPPSFTGFLRQTSGTASVDAVFLSDIKAGFVATWPEVESPSGRIFLLVGFGGFMSRVPVVSRATDSAFLTSGFEGFLRTVLRCARYSSLIIGGIRHEIDQGA